MSAPEARATLTGLNIYPVKSCRGIAMTEAIIGPAGLLDDRHWMLVRPNGRFVTQRELPRLALIVPTMSATELVLHAPGQSPLVVQHAANGASQPVTVWKFTGRGIDCGDDAADWFTRALETPLRLVRFDSSVPRVCDPAWTGSASATTEFSDGFPILVLSEASLNALNARLSKALPMSRFRPNIVIADIGPFAEDRIHELHGDGVVLRLVKPCTRCVITTTDQETAQRDGDEPLATLKSFRFDPTLRGVIFGQNAIVAKGEGARLRVGQPLTVVWR